MLQFQSHASGDTSGHGRLAPSHSPSPAPDPDGLPEQALVEVLVAGQRWEEARAAAGGQAALLPLVCRPLGAWHEAHGRVDEARQAYRHAAAAPLPRRHNPADLLPGVFDFCDCTHHRNGPEHVG